MISWFAAVYFTPWIGYQLLKVHDRGAGDYNGFNSRPYRAIRALVAWCVRRRGLVVVLTFGALIASVASFSLIPNSSSRLPTVPNSWWTFGCPKAPHSRKSSARPNASSSRLSKDPDLAYVATIIGEGAPRFYLPLDQQLRNQNFAQLLLMSRSIEARERVLVEVREIFARDFPNVRFKADRLFNGPPVGWPVQVRVTGPDRNEVRRLATEVGDVMRAAPEVGNVHNDWLEPVPSLKLEIDQDRARAPRRDIAGRAPRAASDAVGFPDRRIP